MKRRWHASAQGDINGTLLKMDTMLYEEDLPKFDEHVGELLRLLHMACGHHDITASVREIPPREAPRGKDAINE
jgi:hypothetical protein